MATVENYFSVSLSQKEVNQLGPIDQRVEQTARNITKYTLMSENDFRKVVPSILGKEYPTALSVEEKDEIIALLYATQRRVSGRGLARHVSSYQLKDMLQKVEAWDESYHGYDDQWGEISFKNPEDMAVFVVFDRIFHGSAKKDDKKVVYLPKEKEEFFWQSSDLFVKATGDLVTKLNKYLADGKQYTVETRDYPSLAFSIDELMFFIDRLMPGKKSKLTHKDKEKAHNLEKMLSAIGSHIQISTDSKGNKFNIDLADPSFRDRRSSKVLSDLFLMGNDEKNILGNLFGSLKEKKNQDLIYFYSLLYRVDPKNIALWLNRADKKQINKVYESGLRLFSELLNEKNTGFADALAEDILTTEPNFRYLKHKLTGYYLTEIREGSSGARRDIDNLPLIETAIRLFSADRLKK